MGRNGKRNSTSTGYSHWDAIVAWVENLKLLSNDEPEKLELLDELRSDVTRLELIADRFSKIGSRPNLEMTNINEQVEQCHQYMQKRASKKSSI